MMTNKEIIAVVTAAENGAKIEVLHLEGEWRLIVEPTWNFGSYDYRVKPPAKRVVKSLAWRHQDSGEITWRFPKGFLSIDWQRFPAADFEGEVEE